MNNKRATKRALLTSVMALVMCVVMLAGTTFAWFTDTASTGVNKIQAGNLDVDIIGEDGKSLDGKSLSFVKAGLTTDTGAEIDPNATTEILWEPGCRYLTQGFRIANKGNLALKWKAVVNKGTTAANEGNFDLLDVIDFYLVRSTDVNDMGTALGEFSDSLKAKTNSDVYYIKGVMKTTAGNDYQGLTLDGITITVYATQDTVENDSFGPDYDANATYYPVLDAAGMKDALVNGGNIKVDADVDVGGDVLTVTKKTTIDMNGKTIKNTADIWTGDGSDGNWSLISARNGANLTITGNGTFKAKENDAFAVDVQDGSAVTIENGTFIGNMHAVYVYDGTAVIEGGFFDIQQKSNIAGKEYEFVLNCYDANRDAGSAKIIVKGGTFVNFNPANNAAEGAGTNFVADGYSVISEKHGEDTWFTVVKGTGATAGTQTELDNAITNNETSTVKLTTAGTYTLPDELQGKDITVIGTKDTVVNMANNDCYHADNVSLEGVTVEFANEDYRGFKHTGKLTYKDCTITGKQFLYGTEVEFINCTFVQDAVDYNVWTYGAGSVLFKDCTFDCKGKAVLIYNEGHISSQNVEFQNCKFNASAKATGKAAIEIDCRFTSYNVVIDKATANNVSGFDKGSKSGSAVWNVKDGSKATTVTIGGTKVN
mgnify:CR=1 FL=1